MMSGRFPPQGIRDALRRGLAIPAHPLALTAERGLDERRQRALTRYYLDSGAGGLAVGVHSTEFAIHDPRVGLYRPVLSLAAETAAAWTRDRPAPVMIAGVCGRTAQAAGEAAAARGLGYHAALVSLASFREEPEEALVAHVGAVGEVLPVMGFYLQPAVGGRVLSERFWRMLVETPNLIGIKIAPFSRYGTLAVLRAVALSGRADEIACYTGNDDNILVDLLTEFRFRDGAGEHAVRIVGGLLGHWAYWTRCAVSLLERAQAARGRAELPAELLTLAAQVTESNAAVFDAAHGFRGCIAGMLYVLRRSGLLEAVRTLEECADLSPGQREAIEGVCASYPHLVDDGFVRENLDRWLRA